LEGLLVALRFLDRVIQIIRESENSDEARGALMQELTLSEAQATAILDMQLRRLAALEQERINSEYKERVEHIAYLEGLLASPAAMRKVIADELAAISKRYNDPRRTVILDGPAREVRPEDLLAHAEDTWATFTHGALLSRTYQDAPPKITNQTTDAPRFLLRSNTADILYLFGSDGRAMSVPVQNLPVTDEPSEGGPAASVVDLREGARVVGALSLLPSFESGYVLLATAGGDVKRIRTGDLPGLQARAFSVINLGDDQLIAARYVEDDDEVLLFTSEAASIRFKVSEVRATGLPAGGMRGIRLAEGDRVVAAALARDGGAAWTVTEGGLAKSSPLADFPLQGRAGAGVAAMKLPLGERLAAATISTMNDLVIVIARSGRFRVGRFRDVPHGRRDVNPDLCGIRLTKTDRVETVTQIVRRPEAAAVAEAPSPNGANGRT
jgi:DNA gyrase subunit A